MDVAKKLTKIDTCSGILDFLPASDNTEDSENDSQQSEGNVSHLTILSQAKNYTRADIDKLSSNNLADCAEEFFKVLTFSDRDRENINNATLGQHQNKIRHKMRHLLVTGKRIKALFKRQKMLDKNPVMYISLPVENFVAEKECNEIQKYPEVIKHGIKEEGNAKVYYSKVCEKQQSAFKLEDPGLPTRKKYSWLGARLDGI